MTTHFEALGGEQSLRELIDAFVDRVAGDVMIGFFFRSVDRTRLKELEYQFAAEHLGADVRYAGRPVAQTHQRHAIFGGQFDRRMRLLDNLLRERAVPESVRLAWLAHNESLRLAITGGSECNS